MFSIFSSSKTKKRRDFERRVYRAKGIYKASMARKYPGPKQDSIAYHYYGSNTL